MTHYITPSPGNPGEGGGEGFPRAAKTEDFHPNPLPGYREREKSGRLLILPAWLALGVLFLAPLAIILAYSFLTRGARGGFAPIDDVGAYLASGDFLRNYTESLHPRYLQTFWRSIWIATLTTVLCILVSFPMAYYLALVAPRRRRGLLLALVVVPFWTSFLIRTYAWMLILRAEGIANTMLQTLGVIDAPLNLLYTNVAVMIGLVYGELPFMILPLYAALEKLDRSLLEASADLGAGRVATFFRVTVPFAMPGLLAGSLLVFIPGVGQYVVSDMLGGGKVDLLGNVIHRQFTSARDKPFGSALAFELTLLVLAMLAAYAIYARRRTRATGVTL